MNVVQRIGVAVLIGAAAAHGQPCQPAWSPDFQPGDPVGAIRCQAVFDDGTGPKLYAAGPYNVWRWDGAAWVSIASVAGGSTTSPSVYAMTVFDEDGAGPNPARLFVGGDFGGVGGAPALNLARYDGTSWSGVGGGVTVTPFPSSNDQMVRALCVFDDGSGPALFVGGGFNRAGTTLAANRVAKWNGSAWSALGSGLTGGGTDKAVFALCAYNGQLHAGGGFTTSGTTTMTGAARWTGGQWLGLAAGLSSGQPAYAMAVFDDGAGPKLYYGGNFGGTQGLQSFNIIRWNGTAWSGIPSAPANYGCNGAVYSLLSVPGDGLYVGGWFFVAGNLQGVGGIAKYGSAGWSNLGPGIQGGTTNVSGNIRALTLHDDGRGPAIFAGGDYQVIGGVGVTNIARWAGGHWGAVGQERRGMIGYASVAKVLDAGDGPAMYMAGGIRAIGGVAAGLSVIKWDGSAWSALTPRPIQGNYIGDVTVFNDGGGRALYIAHDTYTTEWAGAVSRWNGTAWVQVGDAFMAAGGQGAVGALVEFDDGGGSALFAIGNFDHIGAAPASGLAKLVGGAWQPVPFTLAGQLAGTGPSVASAIVFGGELYITGYFTSVNGAAATGAAKWNGNQWTAIGAPGIGRIIQMVRFDPGTGPVLIGNTDSTPNVLYQLSQGAWAPFGPSVPAAFGPMAQFDDGTGPMLYVTGSGSIGAVGVYRLHGGAWEPVYGGITPTGALTMTVFDDRGQHPPALWLSGSIATAGGIPSLNIAKLTGCVCYANCDGSTSPPVLNVLDFVCFLNRFAAADPGANCDGSTSVPVLNVLDFTCFLNRFAAGCP